jgi:AraC family transcriptional regulator, regulatory protein of adaptative response / methylphosphotriester-DNA alkyltransferase methyltransferase
MASLAQRLSIVRARAGGRRVLAVRGEVDLETAPMLMSALTDAAEGGEPLALDLSHAEAAEADGVALLVNAIRRLEGRTGDLVVVCPPGAIRTALARTGLARRLTLHADASALGGPPAEREDDALGAGPRVRRAGRASTPERRGALLAEATLAIERRHAEPSLGLAEVAREIATSSRQLQRVFSELAGSGFRDELAAVRMQHGAELLKTTSLPVAEVARRVGYRQGAQFAKAFRRHYGVSPSGLRRAPAD